jgi:hypothetical protein
MGRGLLRLCLVLSTWNAPLPLVHAHEVTAKTVGAASPALQRHLHEYHADAELTGEGYLDWHIHWVMPWEWHSFPCHHHCSGSSHSQNPDRDEFLIRSATAMMTNPAGSSLQADLGLPTWLSSHAMVAAAPSTGGCSTARQLCAPLHFLASYDNSVRLNNLLRVRQC